MAVIRITVMHNIRNLGMSSYNKLSEYKVGHLIDS